ncbi:MAG TPA: fluoride efflux transporter CrcB [Gemmatimonadales bacterium]|jgi:CrcB protein
MLYLWIAVFGVIGIFARYGVIGLIPRAEVGFPWGTFMVNVSGSFLVGLIARMSGGSAAVSPEVRIGLLVGLCGGYTTFSTYSFETVRLVQEGAWMKAGAYAAGSVLAGVIATVAGIAAGSRIL